MSRRNTASKNLGDDYRDAIGLHYITQMIKHPDTIEWVSFEDPTAEFLDDIIVRFADRIEYIQAKYTVEASEWLLENLLKNKTPKAKSLLQKWACSWKKIRTFGVEYKATIKSRRGLDDTLAQLFNESGTKFQEPELLSQQSPEAYQSIIDHLALEGITQEEAVMPQERLPKMA